MYYTFYFSFTIKFDWNSRCLHIAICFFWAQQPPLGQAFLMHDVCRSHTTTHHSQQDSSGRVISSSQRPLPENTQHSQQTNIHAPVGFEPTISAGERPQTYVLDCAATGTGSLFLRKRIERHNMRSWNLQDFLNHPTLSKSLVFVVENFIQNRRSDLLERTADRLKPGVQLGLPTLRRRVTQVLRFGH
jgi:hypothetical protein